MDLYYIREIRNLTRPQEEVMCEDGGDKAVVVAKGQLVIERSANGYLVHPVEGRGTFIGPLQTQTFESFAAAVQYLKGYFNPPKGKK